MTLYDLRQIIMSLDERSEIYHIRAALLMVLGYLEEKERTA